MDEEKKDQLLYRALASYSDACDVPSLLPSCPFYEELADGSPVCAEQCKDVLSEDLSQAAAAQSRLTLGGELEAVRVPERPRPRRGPDRREPAFDARQLYLSERGRDIATWSMTSLLCGLVAQFAWMNRADDDPPVIERAQSILDELTRRDVDAEVVVRHGLFGKIVSSIVWHMHVITPSQESADYAGDDLGWGQFVGESTEVEPEEPGIIAKSILDDALPIIARWVMAAPITDLVEHRISQSPDELMAKIPSLPPLNFDAMWLADRFTTTYIHMWSEASLQREWRYIHSERAGCCPAGYMRERPVDVADVAQMLAEVGSRHIEAQGESDEPKASTTAQPMSLYQFMPLAIDALKSGDRAEAVSIFSLIDKVQPGNCDNVNNIGFCLLPDDPEESLKYLNRAAEMGIDGAKFTKLMLNIALAHYVRGEMDAARGALERARPGSLTSFRGWMWDLEKVEQKLWDVVTIDGPLGDYLESLDLMLSKDSAS